MQWIRLVKATLKCYQSTIHVYVVYLHDYICISCSCWLTNRIVSYITVNGYLGLVLLFNTVIMVVIVVKMWQLKLRGVQSGSRLKRLWKDCATLLGISAVLGLPWGLAFCTYGPLKLPGIYLFTIFNALQGTLMLILLDFSPLSLIRLCVERSGWTWCVFHHCVFQVFLCPCGTCQSHASQLSRRGVQQRISPWVIQLMTVPQATCWIEA